MIIDAHTHIESFNEKDLKKAVKEINENKILSIANGMDVESYIQSKKISDLSPYIIPIFGVHPWKASGYKNDLQSLKPYIEETPMIGEIGLDFYWIKDKESFKSQLQVFEFFLGEAKRLNKIINIHTKGAEAEILELLDKYDLDRVIVHWYSGPKDILLKMIDREYYFTIGVELQYSRTIKEIASVIPLNRMFAETDGPGGEEWLSKKVGMPILIKVVMEKLSEIKNVTFKDLERQMEHNLKTLITDQIFTI